MGLMELASLLDLTCLIMYAVHDTTWYGTDTIISKSKPRERKTERGSELTEGKGKKDNSKSPEQKSQLFRRAAFVPELISFVQTVPFSIP